MLYPARKEHASMILVAFLWRPLHCICCILFWTAAYASSLRYMSVEGNLISCSILSTFGTNLNLDLNLEERLLLFFFSFLNLSHPVWGSAAKTNCIQIPKVMKFKMPECVVKLWPTLSLFIKVYLRKIYFIDVFSHLPFSQETTSHAISTHICLSTC